ncbi:hypothetical protein [Pseudomonas sp. AOB-7]|uniref:hypothetical protein n=1 Tax=Pseudomonas sp. AOB-7 TaxID=2482750 RepID=UPI0015B0169A|nr:hypothetical protein [Pseudomonas sp. AOB-7]
MKQLLTAASLTLATLLAAQACLAEESSAFVEHHAKLQQNAGSAQQQAQRTAEASQQQG